MKQISKILSRLIGVVCMVWCLSFTADAQPFAFQKHEMSAKRTAMELRTAHFPYEFTVWGYTWAQMTTPPLTWRNQFKIKSTYTMLKFYVDHAYKIKVKFPYTYKLCYQAYCYADSTSPSAPAPVVYTDTITLSYHPDSLTPYQDMAVKRYSGFHKMRVRFTDIFSYNAGVMTLLKIDTITGLNFIAEASVLTEKYDIRTTRTGPVCYGDAGAIVPTSTITPGSSDYAEVKWNLPTYAVNSAVPLEPVNYELEWTYVDNYKRDVVTGAITTVGSSGLSYNFKNNATRVWLDTNYYRIPVVYQKGYLLYRLRVVRPDSALYRYPIYGLWNLNDAGVLSSVPSSNYLSLGTAHKNDSLNWQYTISFAEDGKYKHVLSYFDGLLKNRQSITRFNSTPNLLIATEQVYDYEGRPSISILPTPVSSPAFRYQYGLSLNSLTNKPYRAKDFDTLGLAICPAEVPLSPLASTAGANIYYSPLNPDKNGMQKFVPDAGGYPMVQTIFSPGFDKRVDRQGGAGDSLQIGFGHDTKNDYAGADQKDLNRLFGIDIGVSGFYRKTVVKDPNGQLSMNVEDYEGRQVLSSMIGRGPRQDIHAIIPNENVPDSTYRKDDLLAGMAQMVVDNKKILDRDFYMDVSGIDSVQYVFEFAPYQICTPADSSYLSVQAKYNYKIFDGCGQLEKTANGVLGTTGVLKTGTVVTASTAAEGVYLPQGKHSLNKELTVDVKDIYAVVDTLLVRPPKCFKTEPYFIRQTVLEKTFPCVPEDDCAAKKKQMMDELWPGRKYGTYHRTSETDVDGENSIFTYGPGYVMGSAMMVGGPGGGAAIFIAPELYRYKDSCIVTLPTSVMYEGRIYDSLRYLPVDTFMKIFNDDIAEALLPLHPEYCRLMACNNKDNYREQIMSIPNGLVAEQHHRLWLDEIIMHDPLLPKLSAKLGSMARAKDSLSKYLGGVVSIDTMAFITAYCNCTDTVMFRNCVERIFNSPIAGKILLNDQVKKSYFKFLVPAYFANRTRFEQYFDTTSNCGPCQTKRMTLIPNSVFPSKVYGTDGGLSASFFDRFSGKVDVAWIFWALHHGSTTDDDSLMAIRDSVTHVSDSVNLVLNKARVDSMLLIFANCLPAGHLSDVRDTLMAIAANAPVLYGNFTPDQIRYALVINGITLSDLCNQYIVNYDYMTSAGAGKASMSCRNDIYYQEVKDFLNGDALQALLDAPFALPPQPHMLAPGSSFENEISARLSTPVVNMYARVAADTSAYRLYLCKPSFPYDTVIITLRTGRDAISKNILMRSPMPWANFDTFSFVSVNCAATVTPSLGLGYITNYSFTADVEKRWTIAPFLSFNFTSTMLGWTNKVLMTLTDANKLAECVPCTQMRQYLYSFMDSMNAYGVKGVDHPLYDNMLRNYMNDKFRKIFDLDQYNRFIESCALADSLQLNRYNGGYAHITFTDDASADLFYTYIKTTDAANLETYLRYEDGGVHVLLNFGGVPVVKLQAALNVVSTYSGPGVSSILVNDHFNPNGDISHFMGAVYVINGMPFDFMLLGSMVSQFKVLPPVPVRIWNGAEYLMYSRFDVLSISSATDKSISEGIGTVKKFMKDREVAGMFINKRECTIDDEYSLSEKQLYLGYVNKFTGKNPVRVLDTLTEPYLMANIPPFGGRSPLYGNPAAPADINNLYMALPGGASPGLIKAQNILTASAVFPTGFIFPPAVGGGLPMPVSSLGSDLNVYYCADGTYWYRKFDVGDTLFDIFLKMPLYIPVTEHNDYRYLGVTANPGDGTSRSLKVHLQHKVTMEDIYVDAFCDFTVGNNLVLHDVLLAKDKNSVPDIADADTIYNCERSLLRTAILEGKKRYELYIDSIRLSLRKEFYAYVMSHISEKLYLGYRDQRFNYTLYYYDRAGNLMRTVPPAGVNTLPDASLGLVDDQRKANTSIGPVLPYHTKASVYEYNSLDKVVRQWSPDGGNVKNYIDALGRVAFSQNDRQTFPNNYFTYSLYDAQGRVTETGQIDDSPCEYWIGTYDPVTKTTLYRSYSCLYLTLVHYPLVFPFPAPLTAGVSWATYIPPQISDPANYKNQELIDFVHSRQRSDVVMTIYDTVAANIGTIAGMEAQQNLRKRVAAIKYFELLAPTDSFYRNYTYATHYSYDISGNVKTMVHDYPALKPFKQQYKRVDYDYDLASGKVNLLSYNRGWNDQYYQRYDYDDDNRITKVTTSSDGLIWKRDAAYEYYQHGPLARASIGDLRVQGIDYAYTIQGWLKAINGDVLKPQYDMGLDSFKNDVHAYDAVATTLDYFKGDYKPIGTTAVTHTAAPSRNLYNGNISRKSSSILPFRALMANYTYDQLNRIKYSNYDSMAPIVAGIAALGAIKDYRSSYNYDADGNITKLLRRGNKTADSLIMDSLTYYYESPGYNNRLTQVTDSANDRYKDDLRKFTDRTVKRYVYDATGNIIKDLTSNQDTIQWNLYNKVKYTQNRAGNNDMRFVYDGHGFRVAKSYFTKNPSTGNNAKEETEYFVHDAQGNILAVYRLERQYKEMSYLVFSTASSGVVRGILGLHAYVNDVLQTSMMKEAAFETALKPYLSAYGATSGMPVSYYVSKDPSLLDKISYNSADWVPALKAYVPAHNPVYIQDAYVAMYANEDKSMAATVWHTMFNQQNAAQRKLIVSMIGTGLPGGSLMLRDACLRLGIAVDSTYTSTSLADSLISKVSDVNALVATLTTVMTNAAPTTDLHGFFSQYFGAVGGPVTLNDSLITQAVVARYGAKPLLGQFYDSWNPAMGILQKTAGPNMYLAAYRANPGVYLESVASALGSGAFIDTAVAAIPGMDPQTYWTRVYADASPSAISVLSTTDFYPVTRALSTFAALTSEHFALAEHHLYGSSRLGIRNYNSGDIYGYHGYWDDMKPDRWSRDSGVLFLQSPWYSYALGEGITKGQTVPFANIDQSRYSLYHTLGMKQYEVTNHLGNVLATISDKRQEVPEGAFDSIKHFRPSIKTAYDYYPFGMLMPGRYAAIDTSYEWVDILRTASVGHVSFASPIMLPSGTPSGGAVILPAGGTAIELKLDTLGAKMELPLAVTSGYNYDLQLDATLIRNVPVRASVLETVIVGNFPVEREIASAMLTIEGNYVLNFNSSGSSVKLKLEYGGLPGITGTGTTGSAGKLVLTGKVNTNEPATSTTYLAKILVNTKDGYRFGFNGMEKVNELYGRGDHMDFGARYYDARVGRFGWNVDALTRKYPWLTPYNFSANNPLYFVDPDGNAIYGFTALKEQKNPYKSAINVVSSSKVFMQMLAQFNSINKGENVSGVNGKYSALNLNLSVVEDNAVENPPHSVIQVFDGKKWTELSAFNGTLTRKDIDNMRIDVQFVSTLGVNTGQKIITINHEMAVHANEDAKLMDKFNRGEISFDDFKKQYSSIGDAQHLKIHDRSNSMYEALNDEVQNMLDNDPNLKNNCDDLGTNSGYSGKKGSKEERINKNGYVRWGQSFENERTNEIEFIYDPADCGKMLNGLTECK